MEPLSLIFFNPICNHCAWQSLLFWPLDPIHCSLVPDQIIRNSMEKFWCSWQPTVLTWYSSVTLEPIIIHSRLKNASCRVFYDFCVQCVNVWKNSAVLATYAWDWIPKIYARKWPYSEVVICKLVKGKHMAQQNFY